MSEAETVPPATTDPEQTKSVSRGHILVNLTWEWTQAIIAISISAATVTICYRVIMNKGEIAREAFQLLSNVFFLVVGTYFQRTNHTKNSADNGVKR